MKTKPIFLTFLTVLFLFLAAMPVQAQSNSFSADNAPLAQPTRKPTKTKKPKKSPTQIPTATRTVAPTNTSDPAFSPTATFTASATGTATPTSRPDQPARTDPPPTSPASTSPANTSTTSTGLPNSTAASSTGTASALAPTDTLAADQTPMLAGGLGISLPTETPATPWMETVIAAVSQTASAEYQSPTPSATLTSTATTTATGMAAILPVSGAPLNANPSLPIASEPDGTVYWMLLYFLVSFGFVTILFIGYVRLVVFKTTPLNK